MLCSYSVKLPLHGSFVLFRAERANGPDPVSFTRVIFVGLRLVGDVNKKYTSKAGVCVALVATATAIASG